MKYLIITLNLAFLVINPSWAANREQVTQKSVDVRTVYYSEDESPDTVIPISVRVELAEGMTVERLAEEAKLEFIFSGAKNMMGKKCKIVRCNPDTIIPSYERDFDLDYPRGTEELVEIVKFLQSEKNMWQDPQGKLLDWFRKILVSQRYQELLDTEIDPLTMYAPETVPVRVDFRGKIYVVNLPLGEKVTTCIDIIRQKINESPEWKGKLTGRLSLHFPSSKAELLKVMQKYGSDMDRIIDKDRIIDNIEEFCPSINPTKVFCMSDLPLLLGVLTLSCRKGLEMM